MTKYEFPSGRYGRECILLPVDRALIPIISGALDKLLSDGVWKTRADYELGYNAITEVMSNMANNCLSDMVETQRAIYRLLDTALNGREYTDVGGVVLPEIPAAPPVAPAAQQGALYERLLGVQGTAGGFFGIGAQPVTLADLAKAARVNNSADEGLIADGIEEVVGVLGSGGALGSSLTNLLATGTDVATDGGLAAVQIATAFAQSAAAGLLGAQIDALTAELRLHNRRMFGADATGAPITPAQRPALRDTLIFTEATEGGDPVRTGVGDFLGERFKGESLLRPIDYLATLDVPLSSVRATLIDTDGADTVADLIADAAVALSQIRAHVGPPGVTEGVSALVEQALELLSQVRPLPAGQDIYTALVSIGENTLRAAECCEGEQPGAPSYFPPEEFACESFPNLALIGEVTFTAPDTAASVSWTAVGSGSVGAVVVDGRSLLFTDEGPRQLCITALSALEDTGGPYGLGGNFNPFLTGTGAPAARPDIVYSGGLQQLYGQFEAVNNGSSDPIGYELSVSAGPGELPQYPLRIYVYSGALG